MINSHVQEQIHALLDLYLFPKCAYIHTQIYICISMHTDSQGLGDRRIRRKHWDAAKGNYSIFGLIIIHYLFLLLHMTRLFTHGCPYPSCIAT